MRKIVTTTSSTLAVLASLLALGAAAAPAAEVTRESYKAEVEPICQKNTEASDPALSKVRSQVKADKLDPAAAGFEKAARSLKAALTQLRAVPQPPADTARLTKWLAYVKTEQQQFEATARKLRAGQKAAATAMTVKLDRTATQANGQVIVFGFHYCRANTSRYS